LHTWSHETVPLRGYGFAFDGPVLASINPWAVALSAGALIAIFRFKAGTIQTLAACSAAGMLLYVSGVVTP
jgi:chromate transporter